MACKAREVAVVEVEVEVEVVVLLQAPAAEALPPLLQTQPRLVLRRPAVAAHLVALVRRAVRLVAAADRETSGLPIFRTPRVGLAALSLLWQCEVDTAR